jgi:hypothetical protein
MRLYMKIQTHSPTFLPVLSTSPINYYDGGTVRMNTEFYSWDTSFGLVNPCLRYSCLQVVFCVNLNTFFKCFLQLGWRLTGVRSTLSEYFLRSFPDFTVCGYGAPRGGPPGGAGDLHPEPHLQPPPPLLPDPSIVP